MQMLTSTADRNYYRNIRKMQGNALLMTMVPGFQL